MHYVSLTSSQQLTTICVVVTTCQIVRGQMDLGDVVNTLFGLPPRPPRKYHYETRGHILKTYPRKTYQIMKYATAMARGLLKHQKKGKKNQGAGGKKRRGGGKGGDRRGNDDDDDVPSGGGDDDESTGGDKDKEPEGGGNPGKKDDDDTDIPIDEPGTKRKKRSFSAPPDSVRRNNNVDGCDAVAVAVLLMAGRGAGDARGTTAAAERVASETVECPRNDALPQTDPTITVRAPPSSTVQKKSKSVLYRDANIKYQRLLKNIVQNLLTRSSDLNSSRELFYNKNHAKKDFSLHVSENNSENNNNVYEYNNYENKVDDDGDKNGHENIFNADDNNSGYASYNYDEDDKDNYTNDDSRKLNGYTSDHKHLEHDDKSMLTDIDEIRLKTLKKLTKKIQSVFIKETSGKNLMHYVNSLKTILNELVIDIQKFFETLVFTAMKFDRSVAAKAIQKIITNMVNTMVLFIANTLDKYITIYT